MASIFDDSWINLIFQGRNQDYGAFELRKKTPKNSFIAGLISVSVFVIAIASPFIVSLIEGNFNRKTVKVVEINELMTPPPIDPNTPPPPPVVPPPPLKTTIKFTPPVIKKDEEVKDEDVPPPQEELKEKDAGLKNEKGDSTKGVDMSLLDTKGSDVIDDQSDKIFQVVEQMPEFEGGPDALLKWIAKNTVYPAVSKENDIEGTVYIQFVVEKDGKVDQVKVLRKVDQYLDKEAVRVVSSMPAWKPGKQNGKAVSVYYTVPIHFQLQ